VDLYGFQLETNKIKLDLNLMMEEDEGRLMGALNYSTDLFDKERAEAMVEHLRLLLEAAVAEPERAVGELPLMSERERELVQYRWNATTRQPGLPCCVHELFEQQVERRPHASAVVSEGEAVSYQELNRRANQLGHYLRAIGVGPEVRVALVMERGVEMIVGMLGVMKAGGAYVPMDVSYPPDRLAYMMEDSGAAVVLTQQAISERLPSHWAQTICLDRDWNEIACQSCENLPEAGTPQRLLYIIYTSGSTGKPKGVGVEHRQMWHYVSSIVGRLGLVEAMKMGLVSSMATDLGHTVIYPSLCIGGELHIISAQTASQPDSLSDYNRQHAIDCVKMTPTHMAALAGEQQSQWLMPGKVLVIGGEASRWEWVRRMLELRRACRIENHYGPTECTVGVITKQVREDESQQQAGSQRVALGKPLASVEAYVADQRGELVPIGVAGDLYIGGETVSRGYINKAEQTAER
jgi:amino acid adenylation domain-containing protein